jgi:DNA-3-methyladenine glycosylase I
VPVRDDGRLFEFLVLEAMQAGLSWRTILHKRENFRRALDGFDVRKVARYRPARVEKLLRNPGIIRNRLKVEATVSNARCFLAVQREFGSFSDYLWGFVNGTPLVRHRRRLKDLPARTPLSDKIAADLKRRGFKFLGSTVMYAHMQATGMINDHLVSCYRHAALGGKRNSPSA